MPPDFVVFDLGEVLSVAPPHLADLAALAATAEPGAFATAYWDHRLPTTPARHRRRTGRWSCATSG